jgi:DNA topoisomerase-1
MSNNIKKQNKPYLYNKKKTAKNTIVDKEGNKEKDYNNDINIIRKNLIIVESPAKCKKIEQFLGDGYKCIASFGHIRQLNSLKNIDIENNFSPTYSIIDEDYKRKQLKILESEIKKASEVIIASDADREGEMIAFSIIEVFNLPLNTKRIIFNEITKSALLEAINNPQTIDLDLINAAKARQILDVLVGFKLSPILWKFISYNKSNPLSAGRCQTPALKLIYDNQKEIDENKPNQIYNTIGYFTNLNIGFKLNYEYENEEKLLDFLDDNIKFKHIYNCDEPKKVLKNPPQPLTTSMLQQLASNELHYSPKQTMSICQKLYENGYITYMRTDNKLYSKEFVNSVIEFIIKKYDKKCINPDINSLILINTKFKNDNNSSIEGVRENEVFSKKEKNKFSQEAHEAIRPTNISLQELPDEFDIKDKKMYKLIYNNTLESCMCPAVYYQINPYINSPNKHLFKYTCEKVIEYGWQIVESKYFSDKEGKNEYDYLLNMKNNINIKYKKIISKVNIKGNKFHYTEARLVQLLEEKGIGRPSTFSSLIDKIQERGYVKKEDIPGKEIICKDFELENDEIFEIENKREFGSEKNKLVIQQLGIIVNEFLNNNFTNLFEYNYTASMEILLDKIAKGEYIWYELCNLCNNEIDNNIKLLSKNSKIVYKIDNYHSYLVGKYGPVIKYVKKLENGNEEIIFKSVKKNIDLKKLKNGEYSLNDLLENDESINICNSNIDNSNYENLNIDNLNYDITQEKINDSLENKNSKEHKIIEEFVSSKNMNIQQIKIGKYDNKDLIIKNGKFGLYAQWGNETKTLKDIKDKEINEITLEEVIGIIEKKSNNNILREISNSITLRNGPKGDYIFYKNKYMKQPKFYDLKKFNTSTNEDYKICDINIIKSWIKDNYNIF